MSKKTDTKKEKKEDAKQNGEPDPGKKLPVIYGVITFVVLILIGLLMRLAG